MAEVVPQPGKDRTDPAKTDPSPDRSRPEAPATTASTTAPAQPGGDAPPAAKDEPTPDIALKGSQVVIGRDPVQVQPSTSRHYDTIGSTPVYRGKDSAGRDVFYVEGYSKSDAAVAGATPQKKLFPVQVRGSNGGERLATQNEINVAVTPNSGFTLVAHGDFSAAVPTSGKSEQKAAVASRRADPVERDPETGETTTTHRDGSQSIQYADGTREHVARDGRRVKVDAHGNIQGGDARYQIEKGEYDRDAMSARNDKCGASAGAGASYGCDGVENVAQISKITNGLAQQAGSMVMQADGQRRMVDVQNANSQSAAYQAAAHQGELAAKLSYGIGASNLAVALIQNQQRSKHAKLEKQFNAGPGGKVVFDSAGNIVKIEGDEAAEQFVKNSKMDQVRHDVRPEYQHVMANNAAAKAKLRAGATQETEKFVKRELKTQYAKAAGEQKNAKAQASVNLFASTMAAVTALSQAAMGMKVAKEMREVAKSAQDVENRGGMMPGLDGQVGVDPIVARQGNGVVIGGDGQDPEQREAKAEDPTEEDEGGLGDPFLGQVPSDKPVNEVAPGVFQPGQTPGGGGMGGGGGLAGGGMTAAAAGEGGEETSARYAENRANPTRYDVAGAAMAPAGGGRGNGGGSGGGDVDLNSLLAQFLPKEQKEAGNGQSILDFAGGRAPAAEEPASLLDRSVNIFERISRAYGDKAQRGAIGL